MNPLQKSGLADVVEVFPDRLGRDAETDRQILDFDPALAAGQLDDVVLTGRNRHGCVSFRFCSQVQQFSSDM
jgi:hypothetical protein